MNTDNRQSQLIFNVLRVVASMPDSSTCSQRVIAAKLDIALGLINHCMRKCIDTGLILAIKNSNNSYQYQLTAIGNTKLRELSASSISSSLSFYRQARRAYLDLFAGLDTTLKVFFLGVSDLLPIAVNAAVVYGFKGLQFFESRSCADMELAAGLNIAQAQTLETDDDNIALVASAVDIKEFLPALNMAGLKVADINIPNLSEITGLLELI